MRYKAFMSYSHEDRGLASTIESALSRIATPWYRRPTIQIFRDETILPTTPDLEKKIEEALNTSEYFLLLASPHAARSRWVHDEVNYWLRHRSVETIQIILTGGEIEWQEHTADFDWDRTTALPHVLRRVFPKAPRYLDLRWAKGKRLLSPRNPEFLYAIAEVAASLHNTTKDQIMWRERNQYRSTLLLVFIGALLFLGLAIRSFLLQREAESQRRHALAVQQIAEQNHQTALARQLMTQAEALRTQRPDQWQVSTLLAVEAVTRLPSPETDQALHRGTAVFPCAIFQGGVTALAFRPPQGKHLVTTGYNCLAYVWDVTTGQQVAALPHETGLKTAIFSSDGAAVATLSYDLTVQIWDTDGYHRRFPSGPKKVDQEQQVAAIAFSHHSQYLATAHYDNKACLWDAVTGENLRCFPHSDAVIAVEFSADDRTLATASYDNTARLWSVETAQELAQLKHPNGVTTIVFSPDGQHLATAGYDPLVRLWNITNCQQLSCQEQLRLPHEGTVAAIAFSRNGHSIATAGWDRVAKVWDLETGRQLARFSHEGGVTAVAFDHTGNRLATASYDRTARVWGLNNREEQVRVSHNAGVTALAFSPDDRLLATAGYDWVTNVWDPHTGRAVTQLPQKEGIAAVEFPSAGQVVAVASDHSAVYVWKRQTGRPLTFTHPGGVSALTLSADGQTLATAGWDTTVRIWDLTTEKETAQVSADHGLATLALSADGRILATAGWDGTVQLQDLQTNTESVRFLHEGGVSALAFSPKGSDLLTGGWDHTVRVWNLSTGEERSRRLHDQGVSAVTFNQAGTRFATASYDNTVRVWDLATDAAITHFPLDAGATALAFSATGACLATAGWDKTAHLWRIDTRQELTRFHYQEGITQVSFSPDGKYLTTAGWDHIVLQWPWRREELLSQVCTDLKTQKLTNEQWKYYMGTEEPYRETCPVHRSSSLDGQPHC